MQAQRRKNKITWRNNTCQSCHWGMEQFMMEKHFETKYVLSFFTKGGYIFT